MRSKASTSIPPISPSGQTGGVTRVGEKADWGSEGTRGVSRVESRLSSMRSKASASRKMRCC
eukprot:2935393-Rhodomonas_salina.1